MIVNEKLVILITIYSSLLKSLQISQSLKLQEKMDVIMQDT